MWPWFVRRRFFVIAAALLGMALVAYLDWRLPSIRLSYLQVLPLLAIAAASNVRVSLAIAIVVGIGEAYVETSGSASGRSVLLLDASTTALAFALIVVVFHRLQRGAARAVVLRTRNRAAEDFRAVIEAIPTIAWTADGNGRLDYLNSQFIEHTGIPADQIAAGAWLEAIHPEDADRERWRAQSARGEQYALEFRLRGSDGTYRWFFGRSTPLKDGAGKVVRWLGAAVNVDEVKRQQAREAFLAEAGALLGASLSAHDTLENIARAGIPYLADWCHVDLTQPNGSQETVAVAHRRPEGQAPARRFLARMRQEGRVTLATAAVARSGISTILEGGPRRDGVATFGGSTLLAALRAGGKTLGIVSFHYSESGRRHSDEDIALADEFCARAALAYDNAQLYESEHVALERARRLTGALQRAFLPSTLPQYERFRLDAVYLPADDDSRVGGDWYDAVPLEDGRIAFSIGDVGGHGMEAALAMSRVRQTILTCALVCETPAEVLAQTNRVIVQTGLPFTTCLAGIFDPKSGRGAYATAGQPAPIVATREGESRLLSYDGPPLGIDATTEYRVFPFTLEPGSIGLFYTDGLLEFDRDVVGNERRLLDIAADLGRDHGTHPAISFQHRLMDGAPHRDDVAVLAIAAT